ncbi:aminoglycoside phosphotransferase family protein [Pseudactinotalea sp.]|uniref:aminoglycoside phosphotransferase family protein n=1 Tax=Pseudactinotalea sp. TaxID=1926260 RepID=UPI003B3BC2EB
MSRTRLAWSALPAHVQGEIEDRLGSAVEHVESHEGGYSPGMAATLTTVGGERTFVKAVASSFHERSGELYRDEVRVNGVLPEGVPAPRLRWSVDDGDWVALGFDAADSSVHVPWQPDDLTAAIELFTTLAEVPAPDALGSVGGHLAGMPTWANAHAEGTDLSSWDPWVAEHLSMLAEVGADWAHAAEGTALGHGDARADNMVRTGGRLLLVDWPYATAAAPWLELLCFLPSAELEGAGSAAAIWDSHPLGQAADPDRATAVLAGLAGYFVHASVQPPPPGIPHVRAYQRAQGEVALAWLREQLGE